MNESVRARLAGSLKRRFNDWLGASPAVAAKLRPLERRSGSIVSRPDGQSQDVPPEKLWEGYAADAAGYLESGRHDSRAMMDILAEHGAKDFTRVLDLGCAAGRMLRHLPRVEGARHWGVDISAPHIRWAQQHLPDLNFATVTTAPHLPFEDGYFDLVYAASVFTHVTELADAWLLEVRRVLRAGSIAYITIHDRMSYELLLRDYGDDPLFAGLVNSVQLFETENAMSGSQADMFSFGSDPESQVFYDRDYLTAKWGRWMEVVAYVPQAHEHQSAIVLRKSPDSDNRPSDAMAPSASRHRRR